MTARPAWDVAAGTFVTATLDGVAVLCLKAERPGKDHVNHFVVPLDPVADPARLALVYVDPETPLVPGDGWSFHFTPATGQPLVGDGLLGPQGPALKILDHEKSQRLYAYVDVTSGLVRPRLEQRPCPRLSWRLDRI